MDISPTDTKQSGNPVPSDSLLSPLTVELPTLTISCAQDEAARMQFADL